MKYIVAALSFFDNKLIIEIVEADNWKDAVSKHPVFRTDYEEIGDVSWLPDDLEEAKEEAFNADIAFDVSRIKVVR